jgi:hypothetical protein
LTFTPAIHTRAFAPACDAATGANGVKYEFKKIARRFAERPCMAPCDGLQANNGGDEFSMTIRSSQRVATLNSRTPEQTDERVSFASDANARAFTR